MPQNPFGIHCVWVVRKTPN